MSDLVTTMVEIQEREPKCPVCGETSPGSAWICMVRLNRAASAAAAQAGRCSYSLEGSERLSAKLSERLRPLPTPDEQRASMEQGS